MMNSVLLQEMISATSVGIKVITTLALPLSGNVGGAMTAVETLQTSLSLKNGLATLQTYIQPENTANSFDCLSVRNINISEPSDIEIYMTLRLASDACAHTCVSGSFLHASCLLATYFISLLDYLFCTPTKQDYVNKVISKVINMISMYYYRIGLSLLNKIPLFFAMDIPEQQQPCYGAHKCEA